MGFAGYIGGDKFDIGNGIAVDSTGNAYVTGRTTSDQATFPITGGPDLTYNGSGEFAEDAFIAKVTEALLLTIDIIPGSSRNTINPASTALIPVVAMTTPSLNAATIDLITIRFGRKGTEAAPVHSTLVNIDGDQDIDLLLHFATQDTGILCGDTSASLIARTSSGQLVKGSDSVITVGCP